MATSSTALLSVLRRFVHSIEKESWVRGSHDNNGSSVDYGNGVKGVRARKVYHLLLSFSWLVGMDAPVPLVLKKVDR